MNKILVIGGNSMVGSRFVELNEDHFDFIIPTEEELNLLDYESIARVLGNTPADTIINFAAFTNVGKAEEEKGSEEGLCFKLNAQAVKELANSCKKSGKHLIQISTEYVFDGTKLNGLYTEEDQPNPINWYGRTKYLGEELVKKSGCKYSIARISMPYRANFPAKKDLARTFLEILQDGKEISGCTDVINTPTFIDDLAQGLKLVINKALEGIVHLSSGDGISPYVFARSLAQKFGLDENLVKTTAFEEFCKERPAPLLKNSGLDNLIFKKEFGEEIFHSVDESLEIFKKQHIDALV